MFDRKIIHIDMDCFYAAIECRDDPSVAQLPVGVGGSGGRGVLTTCNYVAREYGCHSAMPVFMALKRCPDLVIKPVRFDVYRAESRRIRKIFREYTEVIEPLSLDEAYLDVSHQPRYAWDIAKEIRRKILRETELTASAGIAPNKMLAKIASDWNKPNGQHAILPKDIPEFMEMLPLRKIPGIGAKAEIKLAELGLKTCGELSRLSRERLREVFGEKWGDELYERCRGVDERPVDGSGVRKSLSCERTFENDLQTLDACQQPMDAMLVELSEDLARASEGRGFNKVFVKLKFANFQTTTKECVASAIDREVFCRLLTEAFGRSPHAVRLIGVGVRFISPEDVDHRQMELFSDA